jgi:uncharacterized repeat protein (TIGR01451 family)
MTATIRRLALSALLAAPLFLTVPAFAQSPTPEGTVITNTATASWTDANNNTYTPVQASVSVTVGFLPGPDIIAQLKTPTPASPSTGNILPFTVTNTGNGVDTVSLSISAPAGISITGYQYNSQTYATLAELNAALAVAGISPTNTIQIGVVYDVLLGYGGVPLNVSMTVTSLRDPNGSGTDTDHSVLTPPLSSAVVVTPDGGPVDRLPSNGTSYTQTFTIQNTGNNSDTYALSVPNAAFLSIVSVNGTPGTSGSITVAAGATTTFDVVYTVGNVPAGSSQDLTVTATSGSNTSISDTGFYTINVIRAALAMTKVAYRDDQSTVITSSMRVLPNEYIQYLITVTNNGAAAATTVTISDPLPAQVTYASASGAGWSIDHVAGTVTALLNSNLAPGASQSIWVRVQVK